MLITTKTIFHAIFFINGAIHYFWYWNRLNHRNPSINPMTNIYNIIFYNIHNYPHKWYHIRMNGWLTKLKNINIMTALIRTLIILTWIILSSNNPINLRLTIIAISILLSITISINLTSWYALILFLIYVGGIIIIFSYFVRLSSNDPIILKRNPHLIILPIIIIKIINLQTTTSTFFNSQINTIYPPKNITILLLLSIILLIIIIIVIKIIKKNDIPLRGFNYQDIYQH